MFLTLPSLLLISDDVAFFECSLYIKSNSLPSETMPQHLRLIFGFVIVNNIYTGQLLTLLWCHLLRPLWAFPLCLISLLHCWSNQSLFGCKAYTQIFQLNYGDTFSPRAKMTLVRLFLAVVALQCWSFYQLDVKNLFLHGNWREGVTMV